MQITRSELNPCTVELKVALDGDAVRAGFEKAFKKLTKSIKLPGFRPGTAPRPMLEKFVDPNQLAETAANVIVSESFPKALEQEKLEPHSQPSISIDEISQDESKLAFTAKVPLAPQVELANYKGLPVSMPPVEVSEEEVQQQIDELRQSKSTQRPVTERGIQQGDVAVVNIKQEGEEGDGRNFMTIAGQTFPQLDNALMGMTSDEIKSLDLSFPENFQEPDWAGKTFKAHVSVRSISAVQMPELDEEFVKSLQIESVEDLQNRMREAIRNAKEAMAADYMNELLLEQILQGSTVHVPDTMWEQVASRRLHDLAHEQQQKGKSMEDYAKEAGMTIQELIEAWEGEAKLHVKRAVIVQRIFELENMKLTDADLNRELMAMAREYNADPRDLFEAMKKQNALQELHFRSVFRRVTEFLRAEANVQTEAASAAPKTPKAKKKKD